MSQRSIQDQFTIDEQYTYFVPVSSNTFTFDLPQPSKPLLGYTFSLDFASIQSLGTDSFQPAIVMAIQGAEGLLKTSCLDSEVVGFLTPFAQTNSQILYQLQQKQEQGFQLKTTGGQMQCGLFIINSITQDATTNDKPITTYQLIDMTKYQKAILQFTVTIQYK